jgi:hypothetical protein
LHDRGPNDVVSRADLGDGNALALQVEVDAVVVEVARAETFGE